MPEALEDARVEFLGNSRYRLTSGDRSWTLEGPLHVHRESGGGLLQGDPAASRAVAEAAVLARDAGVGGQLHSRAGWLLRGPSRPESLEFCLPGA